MASDLTGANFDSTTVFQVGLTPTPDSWKGLIFPAPMPCSAPTNTGAINFSGVNLSSSEPLLFKNSDLSTATMFDANTVLGGADLIQATGQMTHGVGPVNFAGSPTA